MGRCYAQDESKDDSFESLFKKELKRRGMEGSGSDTEGPSSSARDSESSTSTAKDPFASGTATRARAPPPQSAFNKGEPAEDQRQKSILLVNEGLEGLIPRATELIKLGGTFFLAFAPLILGVAILFGGIYFVFGDSFVHGGREGAGLPAYVDPDVLLSNPTVDPYVPYK